jgi:DNA processing protein
MDPLRTLRRGEEGWPAALAGIPEPPAQLRVHGALLRPGERRVAIVGSRKPDRYGIDLTVEIGRALAAAGLCIVSGGAEGIDAAAHEAALAMGGRTIAVLGTGVDVVYPAGHRALFDRIVRAGGALVSEYEDGTPGARWTFPRRNRIISALSEAVLVMRAGARSGALLTAAWARQQGVPVLALPGDVREPGSAGPLELLRTGARALGSAEDVLDLLGMKGQLELPVERDQGGLELDREEAAILGALGRAPLHADDLARAAGVATGSALAALLVLELRGLCEQRPGHYFLRRN